VRLRREWGEWFWVNTLEEAVSPRFMTKQEAAYWLVQFELGEET
jgi:hypothetical protein|tara:strand:+ start:2454 stop:2585 length:132 start_codon:yes stop_codon:yes gene_type:complete